MTTEALSEHLTDRRTLEDQLIAEMRKAPNFAKLGDIYSHIMDVNLAILRQQVEFKCQAADALLERDRLLSSYAQAFEKLTGRYPGQKDVQRN